MNSMHIAAEEVYKNRNKFIIIGLTGRSGSGCSKAAELLSKNFSNLSFPCNCLSASSTDHDRKKNIIYNFAKSNWKEFFTIKVSDIITSFILECTFDEFSKFIYSDFEVNINHLKEEFNKFYEKNKCLNHVITENYSRANKEEVYKYLQSEISLFTDRLKNEFGYANNGSYTSIYQAIGNNIRKFGVAIPQSEINVENIYALSQRINILIKIIRRADSLKGKNSYFVIDAFRNPYEALFFHERYSAFYLFAIRCDEKDRIDRLINVYNYTKNKIEAIDKKENPKSSPLKDIDTFLSQDIATCIQLADIYIDNPGTHTNTNFNELKEQLVRYISLIQHPGLVNPSSSEKLMQIAFTAKLNSGCMSRKVGAVVTNKDGAPKAIGWNSSPEGQTSCLLRNAREMISNVDTLAYSDYEKTNSKIIETVNNYIVDFSDDLNSRGLNCSYCFKDMQNKIESKGNQVHNRSLHAEENAFLQVAKFGGEGVLDGKLFTTASPCDSCSRKAYQLGIKEIYYIDPYPGIANDHVIMIGNSDRRPKLVLFRGAIGAAYHKIYNFILPYKDEIYSYMNTDFFKKD